MKRSDRTFEEPARRRLIVALDVDDGEKALRMAVGLAKEVGLFKIGMELYYAAGPAIVADFVKAGAKVFLDLKLHDIPNTVAKTASVLTRLGVAMVNVHAAGGREMMLAARDAVDKVAESEGIEPPLLVAVTVLTSLADDSLAEAGVPGGAAEQVVRLARLAAEAEMDGVVASAREARAIKAACGESFLTVTPGIRPAASAAGDQKRVATPGDAIRGGADYLVIGRPITGAADPVAAARAIVKEMAAAIEGSG
jgi:orotidine-5'-phosphate decarboxylase